MQNGNQLGTVELDSGKTQTRSVLDIPATRFVKFKDPSNSNFVAVGSHQLMLISRVDLKLIRSIDIGDDRIVAASAGENTLAITTGKDHVEVYSDDLTLKEQVDFPADYNRLNNQALARLAISPSGRFVVTSGRTWTNDCLVWDRENKTTAKARIDVNDFSFVDERTILGNVNNAGGYGSNIRKFTLSGGRVGGMLTLATVSNDDLGTSVLHTEYSPDSVTVAGETGIAVVEQWSRNGAGASKVIDLVRSPGRRRG